MNRTLKNKEFIAPNPDLNSRDVLIEKNFLIRIKINEEDLFMNDEVWYFRFANKRILVRCSTNSERESIRVNINDYGDMFVDRCRKKGFYVVANYTWVYNGCLIGKCDTEKFKTIG